MQDWARPGTPPGAGSLPEPLRGPQGAHGPSVVLPSGAQLMPARLVACPFATGPLPGGGSPAMKLDFQHGTGRWTVRPCHGPRGQLQRERYEADMKLIPNDAASAPEGRLALVRGWLPHPVLTPYWRKMEGPLGQGAPDAVAGPAVDIIFVL